MKKGEKPFSMNVCFALQNFGRTLKIENIVYIYDITKYCVYILVEKRNCALLKNQLKINIKI